MAVGCARIQDTHDCCICLQKGTSVYRWNAGQGDIVSVRKPPITFSFRVKQPIENRVGAKMVPEMMENITAPEQYELLEMSRISGFVNRAKGLGRPTKKDRRSLDEFKEEVPDFCLDFDFDDI